MRHEAGDGAGPEHDSPAPSPRVELEVRLLASTAPPHASMDSALVRQTVIVVAGDETRSYVRECLSARPEICIVEVGAVSGFREPGGGPGPMLLIVEAGAVDVPRTLPMIVLADDRPGGDGREPSETRVWLARPFNAGSLVALVDQIFGSVKERER